MITFSQEKKNSSLNIIKILKLVTKSIFCHQYKNFKISDEINILSPKMYNLVTKYSRHRRLTIGDKILNSSPNIRI